MQRAQDGGLHMKKIREESLYQRNYAKNSTKCKLIVEGNWVRKLLDQISIIIYLAHALKFMILFSMLRVDR